MSYDGSISSLVILTLGTKRQNLNVSHRAVVFERDLHAFGRVCPLRGCARGDRPMSERKQKKLVIPCERRASCYLCVCEKVVGK